MDLDSEFDPVRKPGRRGRPRKYRPGERRYSRVNTMPRQVVDLFHQLARSARSRPRDAGRAAAESTPAASGPEWVTLRSQFANWAGPCRRWVTPHGILAMYEYRFIRPGTGRARRRTKSGSRFARAERLYRLYAFQEGSNPRNVGNFASAAEAEAAAVQWVAAEERRTHHADRA